MREETGKAIAHGYIASVGGCGSVRRRGRVCLSDVKEGTDMNMSRSARCFYSCFLTILIFLYFIFYYSIVIISIMIVWGEINGSV